MKNCFKDWSQSKGMDKKIITMFVNECAHICGESLKMSSTAINKWETSSHFALVLHIIFTKEVQQVDLLLEYSIFEETPRHIRVSHKAAGVA